MTRFRILQSIAITAGIAKLSVRSFLRMQRNPPEEDPPLAETHSMPSFSENVRAIVRGIPEGQTKTYKEVAALSGNPKSARAVGAIMRTNYDESVPCHRVVMTGGGFGGYNLGYTPRKKEILNN